jgi:hypothetical protein
VAWTIFGEFRGDNSELDTLRHLDSEDGDGDEGSGSAAETADDGASDPGS